MPMEKITRNATCILGLFAFALSAQTIMIHSAASRRQCLERLMSLDVRMAEASFPADKAVPVVNVKIKIMSQVFQLLISASGFSCCTHLQCTVTVGFQSLGLGVVPHPTAEPSNPWNPRTLEPWNSNCEGLELWNSRTLGALECWNSGMLEPWNSGTLTLEPWNLATLELWNRGILEPWKP